jgi:hypothetical protein
MYSDAVETIECDRVVCEHGAVANDDLNHALEPHSRNLGEVDTAKLVRVEPPAPERNAQGRFLLFRIGDAWASRNVHAAMLDAMRVCKDICRSPLPRCARGPGWPRTAAARKRLPAAPAARHAVCSPISEPITWRSPWPDSNDC